MAWLLTAVTVLLFISVLTKWLFLKKEVSDIAETIRRIHGKRTSERITVSSRDKHILNLANAVNELYDDIARERSEHVRTDVGLRKSMADISHDLRTPLTSIIGYVKLLENSDITEEQRTRYLSVVSSKAHSLHHLVDGLFTLARLEAGAYPLETERVDMREILSEELAGLYGVFTANGQEPDIKLGDSPIWVLGDKYAFSRVFQNLLQNMVKHGAKDIRIAAGRRNDTSEFEFSNRAEDLRQEDLQDLFQRFFTADRMRSGENTGLGLAIVKEFVEQTGGEIGVTLGNGIITFILRWKCV